MSASDPDIVYISEEGIFLTHVNVGVIEMKPVTGDYDIDGLKNLPKEFGLTVF